MTVSKPVHRSVTIDITAVGDDDTEASEDIDIWLNEFASGVPFLRAVSSAIERGNGPELQRITIRSLTPLPDDPR